MATAVTQSDYPHHPHFVRVDVAEDGAAAYVFDPFTGHEDMPQRDYEQAKHLDESGRAAYFAEIDAAQRAWRIARFRDRFAGLAANPETAAAWTAYQEARTDMDDAYAVLKNADASRWPARIAELLDAQDTAVKAARHWDSVASGLVYRYHELVVDVRDDAPRWQDVRDELPDDWHIGYHPSTRPLSEEIEADYYYGSPLAARTEHDAQAQQKRIRAISALAAGQPDPAR